MTMKHRSLRYLRSGLTVLLGAGATLGSSFLVSRLREKQEVESRMDRLEQMIDDLGSTKTTTPFKEPATVEPPEAPSQPKAKRQRALRKTEE